MEMATVAQPRPRDRVAPDSDRNLALIEGRHDPERSFLVNP